MAEEKDLLSVTVTVPVRKRRRRPPAFKFNDGIHSVRLRHGLVRRRMPYWPITNPFRAGAAPIDEKGKKNGSEKKT